MSSSYLCEEFRSWLTVLQVLVDLCFQCILCNLYFLVIPVLVMSVFLIHFLLRQQRINCFLLLIEIPRYLNFLYSQYTFSEINQSIL